jgi:hypothetical protein
MGNFLSQVGLPPGWEPWGVAAAGALVALLAFVAGRRFLAPAPHTAGAQNTLEPENGPDPFEVGSSFEKRAALRRRGGGVEVTIADEGSELPTVGWVTDRSLGGLGLNVDNEVAVGVSLKVRPRNAPSSTPWIEVDVRSCRSDAGTWQLHCAFRKTPPYSILLLFG